VGLDIGGANLKAADAEGHAITRPFAVWKNPDRLAAEIDALLAGFPSLDAIAVTMTAELADCYRTKRDGVDAILGAVELAAGGVPVLAWQTDGRLVTPREARAAPLLTAAANWHALATFLGSLAPVGALDRHWNDDLRPDSARRRTACSRGSHGSRAAAIG
jgi:uncharacterized hydantoinase/oxoprolinase family protein